MTSKRSAARQQQIDSIVRTCPHLDVLSTVQYITMGQDVVGGRQHSTLAKSQAIGGSLFAHLSETRNYTTEVFTLPLVYTSYNTLHPEPWFRLIFSSLSSCLLLCHCGSLLQVFIACRHKKVHIMLSPYFN